MKNIILALILTILLIGCTAKEKTITGLATVDVVEPEAPKEQAQEPEILVCEDPNSYYHELESDCLCNEGYHDSGKGCQEKQEPECLEDKECSPSGKVDRECIDIYTAKIYKCNQDTNLCVPAKGKAATYDNCKKYPGHLCANGYCVE